MLTAAEWIAEHLAQAPELDSSQREAIRVALGTTSQRPAEQSLQRQRSA